MDLNFINEWLSQLGLEGDLHTYAVIGIQSIFIIIAGYIIYQITRLIINKTIHRMLKKAPERWYKSLVNSGFFKRCANLAPVLLINLFIPVVFVDDFEKWQGPLQTAIGIYLTWVITSILLALANVIAIAYEYSSKAREVPITGVIQVAKLILVLMAIIISVAIVMNKSPMYLLSGFGAMTAILMVVFRDTLMGFVAGVQLATNRMVGIGDWIQVPDSDVDGTVQEVGLITVKVENWDKTTVYLPTYVLIHQSFKNWQGMINSGGRRIKRSLMLDLDSAQILDDETLESLASNYFNESLDEWLKRHQINKPVSNLTAFRCYVQDYVSHHEEIRDDMTLMVRLLEPTASGLPLEIYAFSKQTSWADYEKIQSILFEYLYTIMAEFNLSYYQYFPKTQHIKQVPSKQRAESSEAEAESEDNKENGEQ